MTRLAERTAVRIAIFAVLALVVVWPMLGHPGAFNEFRDAEVLSLHEQAAVATVRGYGQIPLWDPWYCGGIYGLGEAQSRFASPQFLLSLLFGVERAQPIVVWLLTVLGMEGTYRWLHLRVTDATAALRIAPLFALCGQFAVAWFRGWINFYGFELVPFVLYGITVAARGRTHGIAVAAIAFAVILGFGGTFAAPLIAIAAAVESVRVLLETPPARRLRAIGMLFAVASFMLTLAAVRLLPLAEVLAAQPRIMAGTPGHAPSMILYFLVKSINAHAGDLEEPGAFYVGAGFLALLALGGSERKSLRTLFIVVLFLWLSAGYARRPALFALLRQLPVFSALRYPERFLWLGILFACEPAAHALAKVPRLGEGKRWRNGAHIVLSFAVLFSLGTQIKSYWEVDANRDLGVLAPAAAPGEFRQSRGNRWLAGHYQGLGLGSLSCWETHPVTMSPNLRGDLAAEEYVADPAVGSARRVSWSPNKLVVQATMTGPGRLLVNQNWHPGWRASVGSVVAADGQLAVDLPAGTHDVTLRFRPRTALAGAGVTLVSLCALILLGVGRVPFRRGAYLRTAALVLAPWAAFGAFIGTWDEPRFPPPPHKNANDTPAIAAPPEDSTPIGAQFDIPIVLDAAKVDAPRDGYRNVDIDLYFRRTGAIPHPTGMFVHLARTPGQEPIPAPELGKDAKRDFWNGDHQVVGGSFYIADAPQDTEIHDALGVHLKNAARGHYDVWVSFGHVSGKKGRAGVIEKGSAEVNDNQVNVGSFVVK